MYRKIFFMCVSQYGDTTRHDGLHEHGVELSTRGLLRRQDYMECACRSTYTLHSLYLLLWAKFGTFCVSLLTQPDVEQHIHGPIISKEVPLRSYCLSQLQSVWYHIRNNLNIFDEQRSFLVMQAMWNFYKVSILTYTYS